MKSDKKILRNKNITHAFKFFCKKLKKEGGDIFFLLARLLLFKYDNKDDRKSEGVECNDF